MQNFSYVPSGFFSENIQANYTDIQIFMDVTRSFMESMDWVERYFWFGAMYEMASHHPVADRRAPQFEADNEPSKASTTSTAFSIWIRNVGGLGLSVSWVCSMPVRTARYPIVIGGVTGTARTD